MSLLVQTRHLVGLLTDLSHTAADPADGEATAGIYLHCARGYLGGEPGKTDLLVGTSTNGTVLGHTYIACDGHTGPMVWPIAQVKVVLAALKPHCKGPKDAEPHAVDIAVDGEHIAVAEPPDLFGEHLKIAFSGHKPADWPASGAARLLTTVRTELAGGPDSAFPRAPRTDLVARTVAPFTKISSRRGDPIQLYRYDQRLPLHVQIGLNYRGVLVPSKKWIDEEESGAGEQPSGGVYAPEPVEADE